MNTGELTLDQSVAFVLKHMEDNNILAKKSAAKIYESLIREASAEEAAAAAELPSIDLDLHQVQYLQTISEGWAYPLTGFMNELQLVESMHMKTVTDSNGVAHLLSVPITQHVTTEQKEALTGKAAVALKCSAISDKVLAVIHKPVFFANRKEEICARTFGCFSVKHPKSETIFE